MTAALWSEIVLIKEDCCVMYTQRNNPVNLQSERFFNSHENFTIILHDFTCMLLSVAIEDVESTAQAIEIRGNPVNVTAFSYGRFFKWNTHLKQHEFIFAVK